MKLLRNAKSVGTCFLFVAAFPLTARAYDGSPGWDKVAPILEKHCARCHEVGKLNAKYKDRPAGNFGYVLDETELLNRNRLILGNADGSEIFVKVQKGDMPKDIDDGCYDGSATATTYCGLSDPEKAALHDAINGLKAGAAPGPVALATPTQASGNVPPPRTTALPAPTPDPQQADASSQPAPPLTSGTAPAPQQGDAPQPVPTQQPAPQPGLIAPPQVVQQPAPVQQPSLPSEQGGPPPVAPHKFMTDAEIIRMISEDAAAATDTDRPNYRYFTFTHLYNAGEPEKDMRVYRMALTKLLNALSTQPDPVRPVAVDPGQTIYRVDISRLGWSTSTWDSIVAADPYVIFYHNSQFRGLQSDLKTVVPFVRADWFAFSASRPPLYYSILNLPKTKGELQRMLGLDPARDFAQRRVERAAFQKSGVSDNNRMIERHPLGTGMYWESYDFGANGDRKSLFQFPFGPPGAFGPLSDRLGFNQDGGEIIFTLPNGFHAYYLTTGAGERLDTGPTKIVHDPSQRDLSVTNGISCMGCHDKGMIFNDKRPGQPQDQVRDLVMRSGSFPPDAKEIASQIFPPSDAFNKRMGDDLRRYAEALAAAGVSVNTKDDGVEMINALSKRFEDNLNARLAAAELGMEPDAFMERLNAAGGQAYDLKMRLQQDVVPRDQFVALFATLVNSINDEGDKAIDVTKIAQKTGTPVAAVVGQTAKPSTVTKSFDLAFYANANATTFKVGDTITFTLKSEQPCFLTLFDSDDKGRTAVLFPNKDHPDGRIEAGVTTQIPGKEIGGFVIRAPEAGTEHITATCNASFDQTVTQNFSNPAAFTTFQSTRDLIAAQSDTLLRQQEAIRKRLLSEETAPQPQVPSASAAPPAPDVNPTGLVANPSEPLVPITAQKSVVLQIRAHY